jgi:hypothetical protein
MFRQHALAERVDLNLSHDGHPGPLEPELQAADAGEQRKDVHSASGW